MKTETKIEVGDFDGMSRREMEMLDVKTQRSATDIDNAVEAVVLAKRARDLYEAFKIENFNDAQALELTTKLVHILLR